MRKGDPRMTNNKISQRQLISIAACHVLGTSVVSVFISAVAGNDAWLVGAMGGACFIPVMLIYSSLAKKYPGKGLFEINEAVFGPVAGRLLSLAYLVFFLTLCALNILEGSNFLYYSVMPDTPQYALVLFALLAAVYCVRKGIMAIARVSTIFLIIILASLLFHVLMSFEHADFSFILPVLSHEPLDYVQATHIAVSIPFGESILVLMLIPESREGVNIRKVYTGVLLITVLLMTVVHFREIISLGPLASFTTLPSFEAVRIINIANIFSRIESLFAFLLLSAAFFKIVILLFVCAKGIAQITRLRGYGHLLIMLCAFLSVYSIKAYGPSSLNIFWGKNVSPFIWSGFTFLLPLLTWCGSLVRGRLGQSAERSGGT